MIHSNRTIIGSFAAIAAILLLFPAFVQAQATPASKLVFDQPAPDLATAQAYIYKAYGDNSPNGLTVTATCSGNASPFQCSVAFPAFTPGAHTVQLTASNAAGEGPKSAVVSFTFVVLPAAPLNVRIQ